jgi:hypothetical protein
VAAVALGAALLGSLAITTTAGATHQTGGIPPATVHAGSINACPAGTTLLFAPNGGNASANGVTVTVTNLANSPSKNGQYIRVAFDPSLNGSVVSVFVKGANSYNAYSFTVTGTVTGLHSPLKNNSIPAVSHYLVCQTAPPPEPEPDPDPDLPPEIFLGYADDFHAVSGPTAFKPSPWAGDPGVVYVGCTGPDCGGTSGKFDAGAIRIDNQGTNAAALKLTSASVDIGPCHYEPWVGLLPQTANPGQKLILTQTGVLGPPMPEPCAAALDPAFHAETNFDTSERPGDTREPKFYGCGPDIVRETPVINLVFEGGINLTIQDAGRILNTGGTDSFACTGLDEATPWTGPIAYTP